MGDTDKHEAINDLRSRMGRLETGLSDFKDTMSEKINGISREVSEFIHEIDRRALDEKDQESDWKMQHAAAVESCKAKGEIAKDAKAIAIKALSRADAAHALATDKAKPPGSGRREAISWSALIAGLIGLLGALKVYVEANTPKAAPTVQTTGSEVKP